jgi:hypothetical protein
MIKVKSALAYDEKHPVFKAAQTFVAQSKK